MDLAARRRHVRRRARPALDRRAPCRCSCSGSPSGSRALVDACGAAAPAPPRAVASRSSPCSSPSSPSPTCPRSPDGAGSTRRSTATRTRRRRGPTPPAALDAGDTRPHACCSCPGQEFGAFRWGYTVDPPLPGMTEKPLVTRDLLPLGSAAAMDLLFALDDRFQSGTVEPDAIAPVARLLGADTIWLTGDAAFDRFRTARPEIARDVVLGAPGVGACSAVWRPGVQHPGRGDDRRAVRVRSRVSACRTHRSNSSRSTAPSPSCGRRTTSSLVVGSGDGIVDAAAAGLLDGHELVRYSGSGVTDAAEVIVTDSNRARAHHWRGSQDVVGFTEDDDPSTPDLLRADPADERLPVFGDADAAPTVAVQDGPVRARASAYGEPFAYRPEDRAVMAIDGDPATAWRVADRSDPIGEQLELTIAEPIDHVTLQQAPGAAAVRHIGRCDARRRRSSAADRRARRPLARRRGPTRRHRADVGAEHGDDHHRQRRRARPDARAGARRGRFRRGRTPDSSRPSRSCCRRPTPSRTGDRPGVVRAHPAAHPAERPVALRSGAGAGPRDRRCPTTARSTSTSPCASTSGRPTTCSPSCSASTARWRRLD